MTKNILTLDDFNIIGKRVIVRVDLNVPLVKGMITDTTRIQRIMPTLKEIQEKNASIIILSHLGRPHGVDPEYSLKPVAQVLQGTFRDLAFVDACVGEKVKEKVKTLMPGQMVLLENLRFYPEEDNNDENFSRELASYGDFYVNEAFSASHREHASVVGIPRYINSCAGRSMMDEINALDKLFDHPQRPVIAIVGGSRVSTKLDLLYHLVKKVDILVIGGAMANTFLAGREIPIGSSLVEPDMTHAATDILNLSRVFNCKIIVPQDAVVQSGSGHRQTNLVDIADDEKIYDVGPQTTAMICEALEQSRTVLWNGPVGMFEIPPFHVGTFQIAEKIAQLTKEGKLVSIAGGGDTIAALNQAKVLETLTYVSTAGGAFLEMLSGQELPGVKILREAKSKYTQF